METVTRRLLSKVVWEENEAARFAVTCREEEGIAQEGMMAIGVTLCDIFLAIDSTWKQQ